MKFINLTPDLVHTWDEIVNTSDDASFFHLSDWLLLSQKNWGLESKSFLLEHEGKIIGIFPLQLTNNKKVLKSTVMGDGGPVLINGLPQGFRKKSLEAMHARVLEISKEVNSTRVEIYLSPLSANVLKNSWGVNPLILYGYNDISIHSWIIDLSKSEDDLKSQMSDSTKQSIKKAQLEGYQIKQLTSVSEIDEYYSLHLETCVRNNISPHPKEYFQELFNNICNKGNAIIWKAVSKEGEPAAFEIITRFKDTSFYWSGCSSNKHINKGVNYYLQYNAIFYAKANGIKWFDLGDAFFNATDEKLKGLTLFKGKFGGDLHRYFKGRIILDPVGKQSVLKQWLRLSEKLLRPILGNTIINFLSNFIKRLYNVFSKILRWGKSLQRINFIKPYWGLKEFLCLFIAIKEDAIPNLRNKIKEIFNSDAVIIPTSSARTAILLALRVLKTKEQDRINVIIPTFACKALYDSVINAGLNPIFADIDDNLNISTYSLKKILENTDKILAVIVPHLCGVKADIENIAVMAKEKGIYIIEDMAQSFGIEDSNGLLGVRYDIAVYSFGIGKNLMATAGGLLISNILKYEITKEAEKLGNEETKHVKKRLLGFIKKYFLNMKYSDDNDIKSAYEYNRMHPVDARLISLQLDKTKEIITKRINNAHKIIEEIKKTKLQFNLQKEEGHIYTKLAIIFFSENDYKLLLDKCMKVGVQIEELYKPLHLREFAQNISNPVTLSNAHKLSRYSFSIPVRPNLTRNEINKIIELIKNVNSK